MNRIRTLSGMERAGLVVALWLFLILIALIARNNIPILLSHLPGVGVACVSLCGLVIVFSMLAGAIHITRDVLRGKYPYR